LILVPESLGVSLVVSKIFPTQEGLNSGEEPSVGWIELMVLGDESVTAGDWIFDEEDSDVSFDLSELGTLESGERVVLATNATNFKARVGLTPSSLVPLGGSLGGDGRIRLQRMVSKDVPDESPGSSIDVRYDARRIPPNTALVLRWECADLLDDEFGGSLDYADVLYVPNAGISGSPRQLDPATYAGADCPRTLAAAVAQVNDGVRISEIYPHTDLPEVDMVELQNMGETPVVLDDTYVFTDSVDPSDWAKFRFPPPAPNGSLTPVVLDLGDFLVLSETTLNVSLSSGGEQAYLLRGGSARVPGTVVDLADFPAAPNSRALVRVQNSLGQVEFLPGRTTCGPSEPNNLGCTATLGAPNAPPQIGPLVISAIMYRPVDDFRTGDELTDHEFVELTNAGSTDLPLFLDGVRTLKPDECFCFYLENVANLTDSVSLPGTPVRTNTFRRLDGTPMAFASYASDAERRAAEGSVRAQGVTVVYTLPYNLTWTLDAGVDFTFDRDTTLAPGQRIVVTNGDPASFVDTTRGAAYLEEGDLVVGPFASGKLSNGHDRLRVTMPDPLNEDGSVYRVTVDMVDYHAGHPWPPRTKGRPIRRLDNQGHGNEPRNWYSGATRTRHASSLLAGAALSLAVYMRI
jgi:hypothetical protein